MDQKSYVKTHGVVHTKAQRRTPRHKEEAYQFSFVPWCPPLRLCVKLLPPANDIDLFTKIAGRGVTGEVRPAPGFVVANEKDRVVHILPEPIAGEDVNDLADRVDIAGDHRPARLRVKTLPPRLEPRRCVGFWIFSNRDDEDILAETIAERSL